MADNTPWQVRLADIFNALPPAVITARDQFIAEKERSLVNTAENLALRLRSYKTDGHGYRQESTISSGQGAGSIWQGNDRVGDPSKHITFADVIVQASGSMNFKVPFGALYWNATPFNSKLNPNANLPAPIALAENAYQVAKGFSTGGVVGEVMGISQTISDIKDQISAIPGISSLAIDGAADFTSPYKAWCTATATKVPLLNFAAIMFIQMLFSGVPGLLVTVDVPPKPVVLGPLGLALKPLIKTAWQVPYDAQVTGQAIGKQLKEAMLAGIPGISGAF